MHTYTNYTYLDIRYLPQTNGRRIGVRSDKESAKRSEQRVNDEWRRESTKMAHLWLYFVIYRYIMPYVRIRLL